ncbi:MAG TPA: MaoC/PaaZ C-terminal domain-containing protein [Polyangiales bacterium]
MPLHLDSVGRSFGPFEHSYDWRDVALYAAALGAGPEQLTFLLEPAPEVLPTWTVVPELQPVFAAFKETGLTLARLLHTAQRVEFLAGFPSRGTVETTSKIAGIYDMRIGALVEIETVSSIDGQPRTRSTWSMLVAGVGSFESGRPPASPRIKVPKDTAPTFTSAWTTARNQALLYRLTGDLNPIHARPEAAHEAGLEAPILHGLCTYGFAARSALHALCADDTTRFKGIEARFTKPVLPGQTLRADGYVLSPGEASVTVHVVETGELAMTAALHYTA